MQVALQVVVSALIVMGVLWFMWRLPRRDESLFPWAPPMALLSAWSGLMALIGTGCLWVVANPDQWVAVLFLLLEPVAIACGTLVLWLFRGFEDDKQTVARQRMQAKAGISLALAAVALGYLFVMTHKAPFTPVGV